MRRLKCHRRPAMLRWHVKHISDMHGSSTPMQVRSRSGQTGVGTLFFSQSEALPMHLLGREWEEAPPSPTLRAIS
jgi:hypothetical protein